MNFLWLALKNITSRPFRSGVVFVLVVLVVFALLWTTLILLSVQEVLQSGLDRMDRIGADIVVVPRGSDFAYTQPGNRELARMQAELEAIPGIQAISPQLRLFIYENSPYCSEPVLFISAFDQQTDFTVLPWLPQLPDDRLGFGEALAGSSVSISPQQPTIPLLGIDLQVVSQLSGTGTSLDQSLFVTFETAQDLAERFQNQPEQITGLEPSYVPGFMVDVSKMADPQKVANQILQDIQGVTVFESANFFQSGRVQMSSLLSKLPGLFLLIWLVSEICIGLVFVISVNERRRELGVLRVLGSTRKNLLWSILIEGLLIASAGWLLGITLGVLTRSLFLERILGALRLPNVPLSSVNAAGLGLLCLLIALSSVTLASLYPAWHVSRLEPAVALRG